jgi:hypothetical protein
VETIHPHEAPPPPPPRVYKFIRHTDPMALHDIQLLHDVVRLGDLRDEDSWYYQGWHYLGEV